MRPALLVLTCEDETFEKSARPRGWKQGETKRVMKVEYCGESKENMEAYLLAQDPPLKRFWLISMQEDFQGLVYGQMMDGKVKEGTVTYSNYNLMGFGVSEHERIRCQSCGSEEELWQCALREAKKGGER